MSIVGSCAAAPIALGQPGWVLSHQKISDIEGNFRGTLDDVDWFCVPASLGDLDGDGITDLAVGAAGDDDGGEDRGAVWILFLNSDGTVKSHQKISSTQGNFTGPLVDGDGFGWHVESLDDFDGDGITDLAVGAPFDGDGGAERGALWILFLNQNGTVKSHQKISDLEGGFTGQLDDFDHIGFYMALMGDLDGDDVNDLAVGTPKDDDGGDGLNVNRGAVWMLFLNSDGTVKSQQKISDLEGGFTGQLDDCDRLGQSVASMGDLDGDGVCDLAVGADGDEDGGHNRGAVWIMFLNTNGTVNYHRKISSTQGEFTGPLEDSDFFGSTVASMGDLDGDGVNDLAVAAPGDDVGGAVWILFLNTNGTVKSHQKISSTQGGFTGDLDAGDGFGYSTDSLGDFDGDGNTDLAVGAYADGDGGPERGAVWILFLDGVQLCSEEAECDDGDACTADTCDPGSPEAGIDGCVYEYQVQVYADICLPYCPEGCPQPNLDDILCLLDDFADGPAVDGCNCNGFRNTTDLHPCPEDGAGDGSIGLDDILKMLDSFSGLQPCDDPCPE